MKIANKTKLWNSCDDLWYLKFSFRWNGSERISINLKLKLKIETIKNGYDFFLIDLSSKSKYLWDLWWIKLLYREILLKRKNWMKWRKCGCGDRIEEMKRVQVELQSWVPTTLVALYIYVVD
jgi:hypothetical protein